jgi:carbon monoxide dehydrogenase subunit G
VYVKASPRDVWAALHDPGAVRALFPELVLGPPDASWPAAGSVRRGELRIGLLREAVHVESLEARPQSTFRVAVSGEGVALEWGWRLEPLAGGTRVIHDGAGETSDRWTGMLVRLGRHSVGSLAEDHLRALKLRAEAATALSPSA